MKLSMLLAPKMNLKYIFLALFVYLACTAVLLNGPATLFKSTSALESLVAPQSAFASTQVVLQIPEVQIPAAPYIIGGPDKKPNMTDEPIMIIKNPVVDVESNGLQRAW